MKPVLFKHFSTLGLSNDAIRWLLDLWDVLQGLDDWRDGDEMSARDIELTIHKCLFELWSNPFFARNGSFLLPLLSSLVLKWCGANAIESSHKEHLPKAYIWRSGYYDLVLQSVAIERGVDFARDAAASVASIYGETLDEYMKEFANA